MKKTFLFSLLSFLLYTLITIIFTPTIFANTSNIDSEIGFQATPVLDDDNIQDIQNKTKNYWWLNVQDKKKVIIKIKVTNKGKANNYTIDVNNAIINRNNVVDYGQNKKAVEKATTDNLPVKFNVISNVNKTNKSSVDIYIPKDSTKVIPIELNLKDIQLKGAVVGGVNVYKKPDKDNNDAQIINNTYKYTYGLVLNGKRENNVGEKLAIKKQGNHFVLTNPTGNMYEQKKIHWTLTGKNKKPLEQGNLKSTILPYSNTPIYTEENQKSNTNMSLQFKQEDNEIMVGEKTNQFKLNFIYWLLSLILVIVLVFMYKFLFKKGK